MILAEFQNGMDANIAKGLLESAGIEVQGGDDALSQLYPGTNVKLFVADEDYKKAYAILQEAELV